MKLELASAEGAALPPAWEQIPQTTDLLAAEEHERGRTTILVLDEAHLLTADQLEELRLLTNADMDSHSPFACLLVGQPTPRRRIVSAFHGFTPYRFQAAATVTWLVPNRSANSRDDQCVTPKLLGGGLSVSVTIRRGSTDRFRPERCSSASPAMPCSTYRARQVFTVGRLTPTSRAISTFGVPSEANNTIRARTRCVALSRSETLNLHGCDRRCCQR